MALFWFDTEEFRDDAASRARWVNENLGGYELATWLSAELCARGVEATEPWEEDHGCDFWVAFEGKNFLCVCCIENDYEEVRLRIGHVVIHRMKRLREFFARDDKTSERKLSVLVADIVASRSALRNIQYEED